MLNHSAVAAIFWCSYCINDSTLDSTLDYTLDYTLDSSIDSTLDYTLDSVLEFKWIFGTKLKPWYSNEYLVPHWSLDPQMNIWSLLETLILEWIFGPTFKPWYLLEYLVTPLKPWYSNEQFAWIFNGMNVNPMPGPVKCFWCNLGYGEAGNIHAIYLPHSTSHDKVHAEL